MTLPGEFDETEVDEVELRELQARVYARGAEPSQADLYRLHELHRRVLQARSARTEVTDAGAPDAANAEPQTAPAEERAPSESLTAPDEEPAAPPRRSRAALIGSALLIAGVLIGLLTPMVFGGGPALTAEQSERRGQLAEDVRFDDASLTLVSDEDGVRVWAATARNESLMCVVLDVDGEHDTRCIPNQMFAADSSMGVVQSPIGPGPEGGRDERISATLYRTPSGELFALVRRDAFIGGFDYDPLEQFDDRARPIAERLAGEGFDPMSLQIVGEFQGRLVWYAARDQPLEQCLIITDGDSHCEAYRPVSEGRLRIVTVTQTPGPSITQEITLQYSNWGWPYLSIRTLGLVDPSGFTVD